jgi:predicted amidohydrolase
VFPELAVTGSKKEDIESLDQGKLNAAISQIKNEAKTEGIYVIVGTPYFVNGERKNCAFVIGDDGSIKTRYDQLNVTRMDLFQPGSSIRNMWFQLKGVHSIVTIGEDSKWAEIDDLAANRGMYLHFHISYTADSSEDEAILRKQQNLMNLTCARYGAVVNAADPDGLPNPSSSASGASMIVSREGGHNKPAPDGIEHYLPYQTSVVKSAGSEETILYATRKTAAINNVDLMRNWRNKNRQRREEKGWYDWIKFGAQMVEK